MCIFNVFQSTNRSNTTLLAQVQVLLGVVSIGFTYYIFRKQLKLNTANDITDSISKRDKETREIITLLNKIIDKEL